MNSTQVQSILKTIIIAFGGYLVNKGLTDQNGLEDAAGYLAGLLPIVYSMWQHRDNAIVAKAATIQAKAANTQSSP